MTAVVYPIDLDALYNDLEFTKVADYLRGRASGSLELPDQLLRIECLARSGDGHVAMPLLIDALASVDHDDNVYATAAIVYQSVGKLDLAAKYIERALAANPDNWKAIHARTMLHLYNGEYEESEADLERLIASRPDMEQSFLFFLTAFEVYSASRNVDKLAVLYEGRADYLLSLGEKAAAGNKRTDHELYSKLSGLNLFSVDCAEDRIELPVEDFQEGTPYKCLVITVDSMQYRILLDTGNAVGWTVHSKDLWNKIVAMRGANSPTATGSVLKTLMSHYIFVDSIAIDDVVFNNLLGVFFGKPREPYYDANLNPFFIRDRVTSIDFVNDRFILRSKERFDNDMSALPDSAYTTLPCYGYEWPFIPVTVNDYAPGLAMIETGAEDISVKLEFAKLIGLGMTPDSMIWRDGKTYYFQKAPIDVKIGRFDFSRPNARIWPMRFHDKLTGMFDNIMVGPAALEDKFIISFDPFDRQVIIQRAK